MAIVFHQGSVRRLVWGADSNGRYRGREYFKGLDPRDRAKFAAVFQHLGDNVTTHNDTRFKKEINGIFCIKTHKRRLACFFSEGDLVVIDGFDKKSDRDKKSARALQRAVRLRDEYLDRQRS